MVVGAAQVASGRRTVGGLWLRRRRQSVPSHRMPKPARSYKQGWCTDRSPMRIMRCLFALSTAGSWVWARRQGRCASNRLRCASSRVAGLSAQRQWQRYWLRRWCATHLGLGGLASAPAARRAVRACSSSSRGARGRLGSSHRLGDAGVLVGCCRLLLCSSRLGVSGAAAQDERQVQVQAVGLGLLHVTERREGECQAAAG